MYNPNLVTKCNLVENQGMSKYMDWGSQQNNYAYSAFYSLLEQYSPDRILEIGTGLGGFTQFLHYVSKDIEKNIPIRSYDIQPFNGRETLLSMGIDYREDRDSWMRVSVGNLYHCDIILSRASSTNGFYCRGGDLVRLRFLN